MLKHPDIWRAIDELAESKGFSASGLAREAGLDATTFNKSKRVGPDGKKRWPSTESVSKILEVTDTDFIDFAALVHKTTLKTRINVLQLSATGGAGAKLAHFNDDGQPSGKAWAKRTIPGADDDKAFGVEINTNAFAPLFRNGSLLVAAPGAKLQKGDRAVLVTDSGNMQIGEIAKVAGKTYDVTTLGSRKSTRLTVERTGVRLIAKITQIME